MVLYVLPVAAGIGCLATSKCRASHRLRNQELVCSLVVGLLPGFLMSSALSDVPPSHLRVSCLGAPLGFTLLRNLPSSYGT